MMFSGVNSWCSATQTGRRGRLARCALRL